VTAVNKTFINALREMLGLGPLHGPDKRRPSFWSETYYGSIDQPVQWESDNLMAEDGTTTISMAERIHASATRRTTTETEQ